MNTPTASQQLRAALRTWAILNNTSPGEVAQHLGVSQALLSLWVAGRRRIGYGAAKEIEGITGGAGCPEDGRGCGTRPRAESTAAPARAGRRRRRVRRPYEPAHPAPPTTPSLGRTPRRGSPSLIPCPHLRPGSRQSRDGSARRTTSTSGFLSTSAWTIAPSPPCVRIVAAQRWSRSTPCFSMCSESHEGMAQIPRARRSGMRRIVSAFAAHYAANTLPLRREHSTISA